VLATPVMSEAETMAMGGQTRQWQPQAATTMQRPVAGGMPPRPPERRSSSWVMAVLAALGVLVVVVLGVALAMSRNNDNKTGNQPAAALKTMPNLIGKTDAQARSLLDGQNLKNVSPDTPRTNPSCDGKVDQQDPAANSQVKEDATVTYRVCNPPDQVTVPDNLKGAVKDNADQALRAIGLVPEFQDVSSAQAAGTVVSVEKAGEKVDPGTTITVGISKANKVKMPNVVNQSLDSAKAVLEEVGQFNVTTQEQVDPTKTPGTVISQNPKSGATVEKGDKVTLIVAAEQATPSDSPSPTDTTPPGTGGGTGGGTALSDALATVRQNGY
jgi:serine/threonine-protein kinase